VRSYCFDTPLGAMEALEENGLLLALDFEDSSPHDVPAPTPLLFQIQQQIQEYFAGTRKLFDVPYVLKGSPFQSKVWEALLLVPYGTTRTYGQLARAVGKSGAARAVGQAIHHNPLAILVPCHRIIGAHGKLTGYAGGLWRKRALLRLELEGVLPGQTQ
jgi:methylated-DNA-[protein]-cysteine S-methyltransferase